MSERYALRHIGRDVEYVVDERALVTRIEGNERRVELDGIRSVRIARLGNLEMCVLSLDGDEETTIATDEAGSRPAFRSLVLALYGALASRSVPFVCGSMFIVTVIAVISGVLASLGVLLHLGVIDAPQFQTRGTVLALVCAIVGPFVAFRARPKPVQSEAELIEMLPP